MRPLTLIVFVSTISLEILSGRVARAGANVGATAHLSWDRGGYETMLPGSVSGVFPVFVHFDGFHDIRAAAIELYWSPYEDSHPRYSLIEGPSDTTCGMALPLVPKGSFDGQTDYTASIVFPNAKAPRDCIAFWFSASEPKSSPTFMLGSVKVVDSSGAIDMLEITRDGTIHSGPPDPPSTPATASYSPHRVMVWFAPGVVTLPDAHSTIPTQLSEASFSTNSVSALLSEVGATSIRRLTPSATTENLKGLAQAQLDMYVVGLADTNVAKTIALLRSDTDDIRLAEPDWVTTLAFTPSDSLFSKQWGAQNAGQFGGIAGKDLHATAAWDSTTGAIPVYVVVLDSGCDGDHPELSGRVIYGPSQVGGTSFDTYNHGTAVSGIIAAEGNNGSGIAGLDWNAKIVAVKTHNGFTGTVSDDISGLDWARVAGYKLVAFESNTTVFTRMEEIACKNAYMSGMALFTAMGNANCECIEYPAGFSRFTGAVGAMMNNGDRWDDNAINWTALGFSGQPFSEGSNTGLHIDLLAPGGRFIETLKPLAQGGYWDVHLNSPTPDVGFGGTSAAVPAATGAAALLESVAPILSGEDVVKVLELTADDLLQYGTGFDIQSGWGSVNLANALALVSGQNTVEHGATTNVVDISQESGLQRTIEDWPNIPSGVYNATRHVIRATVTFGTPFFDVPKVWPRLISSYGAGDENPIAYAPTTGTVPPPWTPNVWLVSSNQTQATFETYVYELIPYGGGQQYWWPTSPSGVAFAYTAAGNYHSPPVIGVGRGPLAEAYSLSLGPNPAQATAVLKLSSPKLGAVRLAVYDLSGRKVRQVVDGALAAGIHTYHWDLRDRHSRLVPNGIYYVRLESPLGVRLARLVVVR
jgi:hypothetical protein